MPQILYNVTMCVNEEVHADFLEWIKNIHIPKVLQTGCFQNYKMLRLISQEEDSTDTTYAVQYMLEDLKHFIEYSEKYAHALGQETWDRYGEKVLVFRTLLEVI
jgi:hypothetical protein